MTDGQLESAGFSARETIGTVAYRHGWRGKAQDDGVWFRFASTNAPGEIAIAALTDGSYLLQPPTQAVDVAMQEEGYPVGDADSVRGFHAADAAALHDLASRAWQLAMALPDTPLALYRSDLEAEGLAPDGLGATEAERLVRQRIGQKRFREALMNYWDARCPLTGISGPALLRASHIVPWKDCESDAQRLDPDNGLLLSSLWDAAFDAGIIGFDEEGRALASERAEPTLRAALRIDTAPPLKRLRAGHCSALAWHRKRHGL